MPVTPLSRCEILAGTHRSTVYLSINGRATHEQAVSLKAYLAEVLDRGFDIIKVDLARCPSMDSTFLGVLAGAALKLKTQPDGGVHLLYTGRRNLESVRTLGLESILKVVHAHKDSPQTHFPMNNLSPLGEAKLVTQEWATIILEAHELLLKLNEKNQTVVGEVVDLLKSDYKNSKTPS